MKSLVLHIGASKTGSSAIQEFLRLNAGPLQRRGAHVAPSDLMPNGAITGQHVPFLEHLRADIEFGRKIVSERIALLMDSLPKDGKVVVSAENLSNLNGAYELFADAVAKYRTRVVLYIRRQDELLLSGWQQWGSKTSPDFWAWMVSVAGRRGDWRLTLEPWEKLAGRRNITVRVYDRARLNHGGVVADFLQTLGLDQDNDFRMPEGHSNPSYSEAVLDFVKGTSLLFGDIHDNGAYQIIEELTGNRFHRQPRETRITHEERLAILQKYAASNAWVKNRYFRGSDQPLFPAPQPGDYDFIDGDMLRQQKWELATALVYGLSKRVMEST